MNQNRTNWTISIGSECLIKKLLAFTKAKQVYRPWANGSLPKGYLFADVVQDAIAIYLREYLHDPNHQATEKELEESLQKIIVNRLKVLSELKDNRVEIVDSFLVTDASPATVPKLFDDEAFETDVLNVLKDEPELWELFADLYFNEYQRAELIDRYQVTSKEYDNRARRLRRRIEPLLNQHNLHRNGPCKEKTNQSAERACHLLLQQARCA